MADTDYKFFVRNTDNTGWINVLQDTYMAVDDPDNYFIGNRLDEILYELKDAITDVGGGGPGYLGEAIHVLDTNDSSAANDETSSFSTRGGMSIAKSLFVGVDLVVDGNFSIVGTFSSTAGNFASSLISGAVASVSKDTGALIVTQGGLGVEGDVFAGGSGNFDTLNITNGIALSGGITISSGVGSPEGVVSSPIGSFYTDSNGGANTTLYIKESSPTASTGWVAK
jgi:hypothetical protein